MVYTPPRKLTWQWKTHHLKMYFLLNMWVFQCLLVFTGVNHHQKTTTNLVGTLGFLTPNVFGGIYLNPKKSYQKTYILSRFGRLLGEIYFFFPGTSDKSVANLRFFLMPFRRPRIRPILKESCSDFTHDPGIGIRSLWRLLLLIFRSR